MIDEHEKGVFVSKTAWIIFAAICVILFGGMIALSNQQKLNVDAVNTHSVLPATEDSGNIADQVYGNAKSKVIILEYGDYQCPGCQSASGVLKDLSEKYREQVGFVFRNFPLVSIHPNSMMASATAEAAGLQGKFWEMHDALYANQSSWQSASTKDRTEAMIDYARTLGLDVDKFRADLTNPSISKKIAFDQALGKKDGVTGTPAFFVNGKLIDQYVKDGKLVAAGTEGANPVWSDKEAFETLILLPAFKEAGIALPESTDE